MKTSKSKMIQTVIALLIMFVAGFIIPTWGPVTRMGVQYLCIMVGWIYLSIVTSGLLLTGKRNEIAKTALRSCAERRAVFVRRCFSSFSIRSRERLRQLRCSARSNAFPAQTAWPE